ncbi:MAG: FAD:protein FMN transferase, partial [Verrucomicrobiales bacterium]|nr:FAD:protein FMN transferase [Verrucomicrobiales bacterium]
MNETHDPSAEVFKHEAMATWFQIHITGEEPSFARAAAVEAFRLLDRLETLLSRYQEDSEIAVISRLYAGESFIADPEVFNCLALALTLSEQTNGAFDPALGAAADQRRGLTVSGGGRGRLILEAAANRVCCENGSVSLDLGAIGKGYALDRMAELLQEWGVGNALLVGGGSSVKTLAADADTAPRWSCGLPDGSTLWLKNCALGCSGAAVQG